MNYRTAKIRQFLQTKLSAEELEDLLFDRFTAVYDKVGSSQNKDQHIRELLKYCRFQNQFELLLDELQRLRPKQFDRADFVAEKTQVSPVQPPQPEKEPQPTGETSDVQTRIHPKTGKEMVLVPAGYFAYGDKTLYDVYLDAFWIDKTPVTNREYKRFIDANPSYEVPHRSKDWAKPYNWDKRLRTYRREMANHPVVLVSWRDAVAYAKWAGLQLPTEQQWEKAARGTDGWKYPWGNEWQEKHANTKEAGLGRTLPVGQFSPQGDSSYGCVDMSGNVWEWTVSWLNEEEKYKVARGGSWSNSREVARVGYRPDNFPHLRYYYFGFRVVSPVPSGF